MFRSLLRTLPSLSGNFKLACKVDHIDKKYKLNNIDVYEVSIKKCSLQPLQNKIFNRDINISLCDNSYEYDVCKFYRKYLDKFYDVNYIFNKNDYKYWNPTINDDSSTRNKDYEYGCKRLSYYNTGYQFEFYAPIYIDDSNDLPKYFDIYVYFNEYNMKILRINIDNEYDSNYLNQYISKYLSKIDSNIIYFDDVNKRATYFGLDVLNGGLSVIKDNIVSILYKEQLPINEFNRTINGGFERNKLIMRQIIPLAFQFNIESLLSKEEKELFYYTDINIKGNYISKDNYKLPLYDIEHSVDELYINKKLDNNVLFHSSIYSLYEKQLNNYKYDNKININWNHWKLQLSNENNPYYTNININYSGNNGKYGNFPNIGATKYLELELINNQDIYDIESIYNDNNKDNYFYNLNQNISTWYRLLNFEEYNNLKKLFNEDSNNSFINNFFNKSNWFNVKNNYSYVNGILYNLQNINTLKNIDHIDYFNIFVYPNFNIVETYNSSMSSTYTIEYSDSNVFRYKYDFKKHLFYEGTDNNIKNNIELNSVSITNNNIFTKSSYDLSRKQYIINKNEDNIIYYDVDELKNIDNIDNIEEFKETFKDLFINDAYYKINNIYVVNNIKYLLLHKGSLDVYYKYSYDEKIIPLENASISIDSEENLNNIEIFLKKTFISKNDLLSIFENFNDSNLNKYEIVLLDNLTYFKDYEPLAYDIYIDYIDNDNDSYDMIDGYCRIENNDQLEFALSNNKNVVIVRNSINIDDNNIIIGDSKIRTIDSSDKDYEEINNIIKISEYDGFFKYNNQITNKIEIVKLYYKTKLTKVNIKIIKNIVNENYSYFLYIKELNENKFKNNTEYEYTENDSTDLIINKFTPIYESIFKYEDLVRQQNLIKNGNILYKIINENNETNYDTINSLLYSNNIDNEFLNDYDLKDLFEEYLYNKNNSKLITLLNRIDSHLKNDNDVINKFNNIYAKIFRGLTSLWKRMELISYGRNLNNISFNYKEFFYDKEINTFNTYTIYSKSFVTDDWDNMYWKNLCGAPVMFGLLYKLYFNNEYKDNYTGEINYYAKKLLNNIDLYTIDGFYYLYSDNIDNIINLKDEDLNDKDNFLKSIISNVIYNRSFNYSYFYNTTNEESIIKTYKEVILNYFEDLLDSEEKEDISKLMDLYSFLYDIKLLNKNINNDIVYLDNSQKQYKFIEEISLENIIKKLANIIYNDLIDISSSEEISNEEKFNNKFLYILKNILVDNKFNSMIYLLDYDNIYTYINKLLNILNQHKDIFVGNIKIKDEYSNITFNDIYSKDLINNIYNNEDTDGNKINNIISYIIINILYGKENNKINTSRDFNTNKINDEEFIVKFYNYDNTTKYLYYASYRKLLFNILVVNNYNDNMVDINQPYNEFITLENNKEYKNKLYNGEENSEILTSLTLLLKHIYDTNYNHFINILKNYESELELYELYNNNINFEILNNDNNYVNIYTDDNNKKYAFIIYRPYIDNTINTYNIKNGVLFNSIYSSYQYLNIKLNENLFIKYFNNLTPFLRKNFFGDYIYTINEKYGIIVNPYKYLLENKYYIDKKKNNPINYTYADSYSYLSDLEDYVNLYEKYYNKDNKKYVDIENNEDYKWKLKTYDLLKYSNPQLIGVYRYMNFISPVFKEAKNIKTYQLKYKRLNYNYNDDNIYLTNININKYLPIYIFDNKDDQLFNRIRYNEFPSSIKSEYEYEYKSFNDNKYYLLKPSFEIKIEKLLTYDQLLEYENEINTYNVFKKYLKHFIKINDNDLNEENKILFLFNKYVITHHSTSVKLNSNQNKKLYKLKYIFNII